MKRIHPKHIDIDYLEENGLFIRKLTPPFLWPGEILSSQDFNTGRVRKKRNSKIYEIFCNNRFYIRVDFIAEEVTRENETTVLFGPNVLEFRIPPAWIKEEDRAMVAEWISGVAPLERERQLKKFEKDSSGYDLGVLSLFKKYNDPLVWLDCLGKICNHEDLYISLEKIHPRETEEFKRMLNTVVYYYVFKHNLHKCNICKKESLGLDPACFGCRQELNSLDLDN